MNHNRRPQKAVEIYLICSQLRDSWEARCLMGDGKLRAMQFLICAYMQGHYSITCESVRMGMMNIHILGS